MVNRVIGNSKPELEHRSVKTVDRKLVPLSRLKDAGHNPPNRVALKNLKDLIDSMDRIGLLHPLTVSPDYTIIDGHRRAAAARKLRWQDIECNIVQEDPAEVYASVNVTSRNMSGNDALTVWLTNKHAVVDQQARKFAEAERAAGKAAVKRIAESGHSIRVFELARRVCRYCEDESRETICAVVNWLLDTAHIGQVRKALEAGEPPTLIMRAVKANKPVVFRLSIEGEE